MQKIRFLLSKKPSLNINYPPSTYTTPSYFNFSVGRRFFHSNGPPLLARIQFNLADIGEGITECELIQWFVKEGATIEQFDKICEVQSDKATVEITSRYDGKVQKLHYKPGDVALVGAPLLDIETLDEDSPDPSAVTPLDPAPTDIPDSSKRRPVSSSGSKDILATPAVRRIARELGIDLANVEGTGRQGRILKENVLAFTESHVAQVPSISPLSAPPLAAAAVIPSKHITTIHPLSPIQKAMVKSMNASLQTPHFGFSDTLSFEKVKATRETVNSYLATSSSINKKVTFMPFIMKSFSLALQKFPILNSSFLPEGSEQDSRPHLLIKPYHNISVAIDTPAGLVVPNVQNVQQKSILEIADDLNRLQELAKKGQLPPDAFSNGTITISNIGNIAGKVLSPVIPPGTVCIVAIGKSTLQPVYTRLPNGDVSVNVEDTTTVSFSADHRVIDGASVARFYLEWKQILENPEIMLVMK